MTPSFAVKRRPPQSALMRSTDGASDRVEHGDQFDPTPSLDKGGWPWWCKRSFPLLRGSDFRSLKVLLGVLAAAPLRRPARFAVVEPKRNQQCLAQSDFCLLARSLWRMRLPTHRQARLRQHPAMGRAWCGHTQRRDVRRPPAPDDICRALEQSAAENALPVELFARLIWQESRFDARAVSPKGAEGIAQFMPHTASWHGLVTR